MSEGETGVANIVTSGDNHNDVSLGKLSAFYGVPEDQLVLIDGGILTILENKVLDFNELKSQNLRLNVTIDEIKTVSSKREEGLKNEIENLMKDNDSIRLERSQAQEESTQSSRDKQKIQNEVESLQEKLSDLDQERETLKQDKREVVAVLEEKIKELESFRTESRKSLDDSKRLRQQVLELETTVQNLKSKELRDQSEIQTITQRLTILQKNSQWLEEEVTSKTEQLISTRRKNDDELDRLTSESLSCKNELQLEKSRNQVITTKNEELTKSLQEKLMEMKDLSDSLYREKQEFAHEMSMKQKLIDLLENQVKSLQGELNASLDKDNVELLASGERNTENEKLIQELITLKENFEESERERLRLEALVQELIPGDDSQDDINNTSSFISLRNKDSSLRDMGILKKELIKERHQKERLQRQVESFIVELEYKIPVINSFKERTSMLEKELNDVALLLDHTSNEKEKREREFEALSKKVKDSESSIHTLTRQRTDLAHQVQFLLMNISVQVDSGGLLSAEEVSFIKRIVNNDDPNSESDSQRVISERLVEFNNIATLQEKNMELLKTVRKLAEKLESEEKDVNKKIQTFENDTIKEAKEAIVSLQDYNANLESKVEILTKECDAFKAICSRNGSDQNGSLSANGTQGNRNGSSDEEKLRTLEARLTSLTVESSQNNKMLNNEIHELYRSKTQISIELEKERSSKTLTEERLKLIQHTLELTRNENQQLVKRSQNLQSIFDRQDSRTAETVNELIACNSKLAVLETKVANLETEKELLQSSERTSRENYLKLSEERNSLRIMVSQLQTLQSEREKFLKEIQTTYKENLDSLEQEKADARARLDAKTKEAEDMENSKRTQIQWYQDKLDSVVAESQHLKQELQTKTFLVTDLESEVRKLEKQVEESEARIQSYQVLSGSEVETSPESSLRKELEKTKINLSDTYAEIDQYKNLLSTTEESLSQLTQDYASGKQELQLQVETLQNEKSQLQDVVAKLNESVTKLEESLQDANKAAENEKNTLQKKIATLETESKGSHQLKEEYDAQILKLQRDLEQQASFANRAQRNYEEELQKDSNVSKTISELREQSQKDRIAITRLKNSEEQVRQVLEQNEKSWSAQKEEYERQLETSRQHLEDLSTQNSLLYDQIELFSKDNSDGVNGETAEVREILTNLRRERDILGTKLTVSQREEQTLRGSLASVENELDTTKRQLSQFQKEITTHSELIGQHEKIIEQLNQLNLLRESNITLRNAAEEENKKNRELQEELNQLRERILPLESELNTLHTSVLEKDQQLNLYKEEANRWKERSQEILHKHDRIDPEDHKELKEKVSILETKLDETNKENKELDDRFNRLKKQAHEKLNSSKIAQTTLSNQLNELREAKSELEGKFEAEERKVHELQERLNAHGNDTETVESVQKELSDALEHSRELEQNLSATLQQNEEITKKLNDEIDSLKLELHSLKEQSAATAKGEISEDLSNVVESMRRSFEEEKINFLKEKTEELKKLEEEKHTLQVNGNEPQQQPVNYEEIKRQWESEQEESILKRIAEAEENLKKRIRLPTEERIKQVVEKKKAALEELYKKKLEESKSSLESSDGNNSDLKKQLEKDLQEKFEAEVQAVKKKAFEEGKQQAAMKSTLLERKISKLESQLHGKVDSPDKSSSETSSVPKPNLPSKIDEKSVTTNQSVPNPLVSGEKVLKLDPSKPTFNFSSFSGGNPFTSSPQNNDTMGTSAFGFKPTFTLSNNSNKSSGTKIDSSSTENKPANPFSSFTETGASSPERESSNTAMTPTPGEGASTPSKRAAEDDDNEVGSESKKPREENA
ncbi:ZYRO0G06600p [Zygosaccharomyces rouxii]|uniref:ZYRO0G06600p n=1 Tax=Zygosaccharomyces rouxii (strain ATCC 2623 / CBS 732 / NBRC 1130 / NCYC 568 / NRRL Y-229) TaxID=559307 RepID=C5DZR5_ZYGRC|nr:uncharacterized protein ZYRO0G06600g [Zygosaccharomyces rouxii]KAH9202347.1 hypothetical protein LQ764DRAFT_20247 [Zygosaccharomyces rouxii]CAR29349.1 ZYRO0G06600p [Zygosaccharomyces rouxii]